MENVSDSLQRNKNFILIEYQVFCLAQKIHCELIGKLGYLLKSGILWDILIIMSCMQCFQHHITFWRHKYDNVLSNCVCTCVLCVCMCVPSCVLWLCMRHVCAFYVFCVFVIGACRPRHARVISKHCVLISQGPDAKTCGMPSDQHKHAYTRTNDRIQCSAIRFRNCASNVA